MSLKELSDNQIKILALKELGCSFDEIGNELGMSGKLAKINYSYAKHQFNNTILNKDSILTDEQKNELLVVFNSLINYLRELKELDKQELTEIPFKDLIKISAELAEKLGVPFDEKEFI